MKVVEGNNQAPAGAAPTPLKFKLGDKVQVTGEGFCNGAVGTVVDWYVEQGKFEIWVSISPSHMKSIFMKPEDLEKVLTDEDLKKACES